MENDLFADLPSEILSIVVSKCIFLLWFQKCPVVQNNLFRYLFVSYMNNKIKKLQASYS